MDKKIEEENVKKITHTCLSSPHPNPLHRRENRKFAFTLAELLITIAVVGVVAVLSLPNLFNAYRAGVMKTRFNKFNSSLSQVTRMMTKDDIIVAVNSFNVSGNKKMWQVMLPYFKNSVDCGIYNKSTKKGCSKSSKKYKTYNGNNMNYGNFDDGEIYLSEGISIYFENQYAINKIWLSVDLNGFNTPPNRWGYDLFTFQLVGNDFRPMGEAGTSYSSQTYCSETSTDSLNGVACAALAKSDPNYFKSLKY